MSSTAVATYLKEEGDKANQWLNFGVILKSLIGQITGLTLITLLRKYITFVCYLVK